MRTAWTRGRYGLLFALAGCAPSVDDSALVRLDLAQGFVACDAQQAQVEAFTREVFDQLEQPMPADLSLTLHIVGREEFEELGVCSNIDAGGCAFEGEAWSTGGGGADLHELAHVIMLELAPRSIGGLGEGIAETLGTASPPLPESPPRVPLATYVTQSSNELDNGERLLAAFFTTFLLDEFGPQAYLDLYRSLPSGSSIDDVDARMREHLGASLAELEARFADPSEPRCMVALAHCGELYGPPMEPPFELEPSLGCDEPGVLGYTAEDGSRRPFRRWQMTIPRDGTYWVEAEGAVVSVLRCGACEERELFAFNGTALMDGASIDLAAGLYTLEVTELLDGHDTFRLVVRETQ